MKSLRPRLKVAIGLLGALVIAVVVALVVFAAGDSQPQSQSTPGATLVVQVTQPPAPSPTQIPLISGGDKPRPNATQLTQLTQIIEYNEAHNITPGPPFQGQLNGFTFVSQQPYSGGGPIPTPDLAGLPCGGGTKTVPSPQGLYGVGVLSEHGSPLANSSGLDFDATYVPSGFTPQLLQWQDFGTSGHVIVNECVDANGTVVSILGLGETWISSGGPSNDPTWTSLRHFRIGRALTSQPKIAAAYAREQLEATTINGHPAIVVHPIYTGEQLSVFMRDDDSVWTVQSRDLSVGELVKIAQGLR